MILSSSSILKFKLKFLWELIFYFKLESSKRLDNLVPDHGQYCIAISPFTDIFEKIALSEIALKKSFSSVFFKQLKVILKGASLESVLSLILNPVASDELLKLASKLEQHIFSFGLFIFERFY